MVEPAGILGEIARHKKAEIAERFAGVSIESLRARARPARHSLAAALTQPGARFILEVKKASPSAGAIRAGADPAVIARSYAGVADALSVLIDLRYFGGSSADLGAARTQFDGPILAKDFFLDPRQVVEARIAGADAILVMLSLVDDSTARALIAEAKMLAMEALVEVHDAVEARRAVALGAPIIGINNRDFRDLTVDLATTERLAALIPGDRILVSESGIKARADVERLAGSVDAFLVGSSLMRAKDVGDAARNLVFGRVKLCGLTSLQDVRSARSATHAGFIFVPGTPRNLSPEMAAPLVTEAHALGLRAVGVFRGASDAEIAALASDLALDAVQVHGVDDADVLRITLPPRCELWCALDASRAFDDPGGDRLLFDNRAGGSGEPFDWSLIARHPRLSQSLVAGGIGASNVVAARALGAYAIDVGSAVDDVPGRKSPAKIAALFDALRPTARQELRACA